MLVIITNQSQSWTLVILLYSFLQYINMTGVRVCLKELYETKYDPLSISYTVLSGKKQNVCPVSSGINIISLNKAVSATHILYRHY